MSSRDGFMITAKDLVKIYKNKVKAVDKISFEVKNGEIFGFLGPNGAGKTTTIKMLTTLATVTEGSATVAGHDVASNPAGVRASIGLVPQELTADEELKGIENLMLSARLHHVPIHVARKRADDLLKLVDLESAADRRVKTYSGGMRRRLQLAMGLLHTPKVLFMDEPTLGLDIQTRSKMWEYLQKLNRDDGLTIFMTTHYLEEADSLCNRIAIIDEGTIKVSGPPAELKERLGGDILTIEVAVDSDLTGFFESFQDVSGVTKKDHTYRIKLPKTEKALSAIVGSLTEKGIDISTISFTKPTLDQVFLDVTGRSMRDEESPAAPPAWIQAAK
jgi:ABC-2 type transport system ATP-binding protein